MSHINVLIYGVILYCDDSILPLVSRFGGGNRAKESVISKLKAFFEKYFGIGGSVKSSEEPEEKKVVTYIFAPREQFMVAESASVYGENK